MLIDSKDRIESYRAVDMIESIVPHVRYQLLIIGLLLPIFFHSIYALLAVDLRCSFIDNVVRFVIYERTVLYCTVLEPSQSISMRVLPVHRSPIFHYGRSWV